MSNTRPLKILFMGTPEFGAIVLQALAKSEHDIVGVVTQPDRPAGRKNLLTPPPVKTTALEFGLPILQLEKLRGKDAIEQLRTFNQDADLFVVASFGMILPSAVLEMPRLGCLNVHGSLLPEYRGASPVAKAILDGRSETGVTIMLMERGLDTGPMLSRQIVPIETQETQLSLMTKLAYTGANLLLQTIPLWAKGEILPVPQDDAKASLTTIISKEDGHIDWTKPAVHIERMIRAYDPWPGVFTYWNNSLLKILRAAAYTNEEVNVIKPSDVIPVPGKVFTVQVGENSTPVLAIATGEGWIVPRDLQLAGKKPVNARDFLSGQSTIVGAELA